MDTEREKIFNSNCQIQFFNGLVTRPSPQSIPTQPNPTQPNPMPPLFRPRNNLRLADKRQHFCKVSQCVGHVRAKGDPFCFLVGEGNPRMTELNVAHISAVAAKRIPFFLFMWWSCHIKN